VTQEALTNVVRHAHASRAELTLDHADGVVRAVVRDDGDGFAEAPPGHGGIRGMRERALLVRGTVDVVSAPGQGTEVTLTIPAEDR
jgi:two-component system, NarL family, sensor histidine kinase UhpB